YENPIDARRYTYEDWIRFVFDHPVPADQSDKEWYFEEDYAFICDPNAVLGYYIRLFRDPWPALKPYTDEQIEQGLWFIACNHLLKLFYDEDIPPTMRAECIEAMSVLFRDFF